MSADDNNDLPPEGKSGNTRRNYEVGYQKPPKHTRFKKGRSGNPNGRPKGVRNLKTELNEELSETITITENGERRKISKMRGIAKTATAKSLNGDVRTGLHVLELSRKINPEQDKAEQQDDDLSPDEADAFQRHIDRLVQAKLAKKEDE